MTQFIALVPAAGSGSRMGGAVPKQYSMLLGKPMIRHVVESLCEFSGIIRVFVVLAESDAYWQQYDWSEFGDKLVPLRCGGETRALSVVNGLQAIDAGEADWVMVHDAARPCIDRDSLNRLLDELEHDAVGGLLALPVADTLKRELDGRIAATVPRDGLWQAQTPQMFRYGLLLEALAKAPQNQTDEAGAVEALGLSPKLVLGDPRNFKVTYPRDIEFAEMILAGWHR